MAHGSSSRDGRLHGNRQLVEAYDKDKGISPAKPKREGGGHSGGQSVEDGPTPASSHTITKNEGGGYTSTLTHEDGSESTADHETLADAHEHGRAAMDDTENAPMEHDSADRAGDRSSIERHAGSRRHHQGGGGGSGDNFMD